MFNVVVVVLFLIALGLLWKTREHLAPTANILEPTSTAEGNYKSYTPEQQQKIWDRLPESSKNFMFLPYKVWIDAGYNKDEMTQHAQGDASRIIANFYSEVYAPASSPITDSDVDNWLRGLKIQGIQKEHGDLLKAYFVQSGQTSAPDTPPTPQPAAEPNATASAPQPVLDNTTASAPQPVLDNTTASAPQPVPNAVMPPSDGPPLQQPSRTIDVTAPTSITINVRP
jgi:hypothetical protein